MIPLELPLDEIMDCDPGHPYANEPWCAGVVESSPVPVSSVNCFNTSPFAMKYKLEPQAEGLVKQAWPELRLVAVPPTAFDNSWITLSAPELKPPMDSRLTT